MHYRKQTIWVNKKNHQRVILTVFLIVLPISGAGRSHLYLNTIKRHNSVKYFQFVISILFLIKAVVCKTVFLFKISVLQCRFSTKSLELLKNFFVISIY